MCIHMYICICVHIYIYTYICTYVGLGFKADDVGLPACRMSYDVAAAHQNYKTAKMRDVRLTVVDLSISV